MNYTQELKKRIDDLQDGIDGKNLELQVMENEMTDVFKSSVAASQITQMVLQIMIELNQHVQKKGWSDAARASQTRLIKMLGAASVMMSATDENYRLKLVNAELYKNYQLLRVQNKEMRLKLENIEKAENF